MCPQLPRLFPEYSHKAGLQTVITGIPLQIRPVIRGGHAGPVTMGRNARGPLSWTRPHCGMPSLPVFVWCRSKRRVSLPALSLSEQRLSSGDFERRVAFLPSLQQTAALSPLTEARGRQQGLDSLNSCPLARLQHSSDGHDTTRTGCQNLSGCHDGMYLGR
jgi:hypothetical protein